MLCQVSGFIIMMLLMYHCPLLNLFLLFRPKHPTKVHVWAGISKKGRTGICVFEGIMKKELFVSILEGTLLPFITNVYADEHRFMQDNDPIPPGMLQIGSEKTPAESPDLNPIENLWHELKEFIRREVKPTTKDQLTCLLYTSPSPRDATLSRMPSSA